MMKKVVDIGGQAVI